MRYQTVFEMSEKPFDWTFLGVGLGLTALTALFTFVSVLKLRAAREEGQDSRVEMGLGLSILCLAFALCWTLFVAYSSWADRARLQKRLRNGEATTVTGIVKDFLPMPPGGHANERFCVRDECFEYSAYSKTMGFNQTQSEGGPIREGLPVRVTYVGNTIVRLEIADGAAP